MEGASCPSSSSVSYTAQGYSHFPVRLLPIAISCTPLKGKPVNMLTSFMNFNVRLAIGLAVIRYLLVRRVHGVRQALISHRAQREWKGMLDCDIAVLLSHPAIYVNTSRYSAPILLLPALWCSFDWIPRSSLEGAT